MNAEKGKNENPANGNDSVDPIVIIDDGPGDTTIRPRRIPMPRGWPWPDLSALMPPKQPPEEPVGRQKIKE